MERGASKNTVDGNFVVKSVSDVGSQAEVSEPESPTQMDAYDIFMPGNSARLRSSLSFVDREADEQVLAKIRGTAYLLDSLGELDENEYETDLAKALAYWKKVHHKLKIGTPNDVETESRFLVRLDEHDIEVMLLTHIDHSAARNWARFDTFFGILVVLNGCLLGLTTDDVLNEGGMLAKSLERFFLACFTIEWCIRWRFNKEGLHGMLTDPWSILDLATIMLSFVDECLLALEMESNMRAASVLRVLRLLRLIRLVRLLRLMKELWILVNGMFVSVHIVCWALLMIVVVSYIFGLLLYEVLDCNSRADDPRIVDYCGDLWKTMLSQVQVATYDGAQELRLLSAEYLGGGVLILFAAFVAVASIGVLNLIIAVMLTSAIAITRRERNCEESTDVMNSHRALRNLQEVLTAKCREIDGDVATPMLSRGCLLQWLEDNEVVDLSGTQSRNLVSVAMGSLSSATWMAAMSTTEGTLERLFDEAGVNVEDINTVFNEVESIRGFGRISVDDFIEGLIWNNSTVHPLDVLSVMQGLQHVNSRLDRIKSNLVDTVRCLDETHAELGPLLCRAEPEAEAPQVVVKREHGNASVNSLRTDIAEQERFIEMQEQTRSRALDKWMKFDALFSIVVVVNAVVIGVDVSLMAHRGEDRKEATFQDAEGEDIMWLAIEIAFCAIYFFEGCMRIVLYYQIEHMQVLRTWYTLPSLIFDMKFDTFKKVINIVPGMLYGDWCFALESVIVLIGVADILLRMFGFQANLNFVKVVRFVRVLRLMRLTQRVRELSILTIAFAKSLYLLFWSLVLLTGVIYTFALFTLSMLQATPEAKKDPMIQKHWGTIGRAMMSLGEIATLSNWTRLMDDIGKYHHVLYCFFFVFIGVTALGILNLVTGIMVEAAFHTVVGTAGHAQTHLLTAAREALTRATKEVSLKAWRQYAENQKDAREHLDNLKWKAAAQKYDDDITHTKSMESYNTQELDDVSVGESTFNADNVCEVRSVLWVSAHQVVVCFKLTASFDWEPSHAVLSWDGGAVTPSLVLADVHQKREALPHAHQKRTELTGKLVFSAVPHLHCCSFTFGGGFSSLDVFPDVVEESSLEDHPLLSIEAPIEGEMSLREFNMILSDVKLLSQIGLAGLRPDQALMVFHKLDVSGLGRVNTNAFIDGLLRMKQGVQGLDVAASRSTMRRLILESGNLVQGAMQQEQAFAQIVQRLRCVTISPVTQDAEDRGQKMNPSFDFDDKKMTLELQIEAFKQRVKSLEGNVATRREMLARLGDVDLLFDGASDVGSIGSRGDGWD
mmetsp:Transcript_120163/g.340128  ORF Transcript_120163/g.340128 Transcript_120163/m.340128 type:complete len:1285 (-) Transcript_120163:58-3912(-)